MKGDVRNRNSWYQRRATAAVGQVLPLQMGTTWPHRLPVSQGLGSAPPQWSGPGHTCWAQKESVCRHRHPEQHCPASARSLWRSPQLWKIRCYTLFASTTRTTVSWLPGNKPWKPPLSEYCESGCLKAQTEVGKHSGDTSRIKQHWGASYTHEGSSSVTALCWSHRTLPRHKGSCRKGERKEKVFPFLVAACTSIILKWNISFTQLVSQTRTCFAPQWGLGSAAIAASGHQGWSFWRLL